MSEAHDVAVVLASYRAPALLRECLDSLRDQCTRAGAALIVARSCTDREFYALSEAYSWAHWVAVPAGANIPQHRGAGMAAANADVVALIEDHCIAESHWLERLLAAPAADVVGGAMGNARTTRIVDWGAFFSEYGLYAGGDTRADGAVAFTSANLAYGRRVLPLVTKMALAGEWENVIHDRLRDEGATFTFEPAARVLQNQSYLFRDFCVDRYRHGYRYARRRLAVEPGARRALLLTASVAVPAVLARRIFRAVPKSDVRFFLRALPATFAFLASWAVGEARGYLSGALQLDYDIANDAA